MAWITFPWVLWRSGLSATIVTVSAKARTVQSMLDALTTFSTNAATGNGPSAAVRGAPEFVRDGRTVVGGLSCVSSDSRETVVASDEDVVDDETVLGKLAAPSLLPKLVREEAAFACWPGAA